MKKTRKKTKSLTCKICPKDKKVSKKAKCCPKSMARKEKGTWNA